LGNAIAWLAAANVAAFLVYGWDKHRARVGARRVPERVLLALALVGGCAGAWAGVLAFRHKTRKTAFLAGLVAATLVPVLALAWLLRG